MLHIDFLGLIPREGEVQAQSILLPIQEFIGIQEVRFRIGASKKEPGFCRAIGILPLLQKSAKWGDSGPGTNHNDRLRTAHWETTERVRFLVHLDRTIQ